MNRVFTHFETVINYGAENEKRVSVKQNDIIKVWVDGSELVPVVGRISQITEESMIIDHSEKFRRQELRVATAQIVDMEVLNNDYI